MRAVRQLPASMTSVVEAPREHNPDARLHPWLTEADIVALGYPPERGLSASGVRSRKARVLEDLAAFEAEGLIIFEAHPVRRPHVARIYRSRVNVYNGALARPPRSTCRLWYSPSCMR